MSKLIFGNSLRDWRWKTADFYFGKKNFTFAAGTNKTLFNLVWNHVENDSEDCIMIGSFKSFEKQEEDFFNGLEIDQNISEVCKLIWGLWEEKKNDEKEAKL